MAADSNLDTKDMGVLYVGLHYLTYFQYMIYSCNGYHQFAFGIPYLSYYYDLLIVKPLLHIDVFGSL